MWDEHNTKCAGAADDSEGVEMTNKKFNIESESVPTLACWDN